MQNLIVPQNARLDSHLAVRGPIPQRKCPGLLERKLRGEFRLCQRESFLVW